MVQPCSQAAMSLPLYGGCQHMLRACNRASALPQRPQKWHQVASLYFSRDPLRQRHRERPGKCSSKLQNPAQFIFQGTCTDLFEQQPGPPAPSPLACQPGFCTAMMVRSGQAGAFWKARSMTGFSRSQDEQQSTAPQLLFPDGTSFQGVPSY